MIDPDGGRFTYAYDAAGRSEWLVNPHDERTTFAYNDAGELELQTLGNASGTSYSYDAGGRVEAVLNATSTGTILSSFDYAYDNVGNRTGVVEADGSRVTWSYDDDYRLRSEHCTDNLAWESMTVDQWDRMTVDEWDAMEVSGAGGGYRITHTYDPVGNRLVQNDSGTRTTYAYDAANQLETGEDFSGTTTYTYDATGNLELQEAPSGRTTHTWDIENRLTRVWLPSGVRNTMIYNADGLRVQKDDSTGTSKSIRDQRNILLETNSLGITQGLYTLQPDVFGNLLSQRRGSTSHFHHFDALGSTVGLSNASQVLSETYLYKAFGETLAATGTTLNFLRWVGRQGYGWDQDLGQCYVRSRHYNANLARWLSQDPLLFGGGPNLHLYASARPTGIVDPSGESVIVYLVVGAVVIAVFVVGLYIWQQWGTDYLTESQARTVAQLLQDLKTCAASCDDQEVINNLDALNIVGVFEPGSLEGPEAMESSVTQNGWFFGLGNSTILSADFFSRDKCSQYSTLLHESYHAGTEDLGSDVSDPGYNYVDNEKWPVLRRCLGCD